MLYALLYAWLLYSHVVWSVVCTIGIQSRCIYLSIGINVRFAAMMADVGDGLL